MSKKRKDLSKSSESTSSFGNAFAGLQGLVADNKSNVGIDESIITSDKVTALIKDKPRKFKIHLQKERSGRKGKTVVVMKGFPKETDFQSTQFQQLIKNLKKSLGCTVQIEEQQIVVHGDLKERLKTLLEKLEYQVK